MFKTSHVALSAVCLAFTTLPLEAAPVATQQEADRLKAVLERYVGRSGPADPARLTIVPEGSVYRVSFDIKQIMKALEPLGVSVDPVTEVLLLAPNDDGTWHVASGPMPPMVLHVKDQTITLASAKASYAATYDPRLRVFVDQTLTQDGSTLDQEAPNLSQHRQTAHSVLSQKATAADATHVDLDARYAVSDMKTTLTLRSPAAKASDVIAPAPDASAGAVPELESTKLDYAVSSGSSDVHVDRLQAGGLLDLWAFFLAHPTRDAVADAQEELRALLKAGMPFLSGLRETAAVQGLAIRSTMGEIKAASAGLSIELADLSGAGRVSSTLKVEGLSLPSDSLPVWSVGLLPSIVELRPSVGGLHVDEGAREAIARFDLKHDGLTPEQQRDIGHILWPGDGKLTIGPSRIVSPLLDLRFEGEGTIAGAPNGHLTISVAGLDKAIETLQLAAGTDPAAGQVLAQIVMAKNLGKPAEDGRLLWEVVASADGALSVNGVPMK